MPTDVSTASDLIDSDISRAQTLPAKFYRDQHYFEEAREKIFARTWQFVCDADRLTVPGHVVPVEILPGYLDERIVFTRDNQDKLNCVSNVCTHRGALLVEGECHTQSMRCRYHGRRFGLDGQFLSTPGFEGAVGFPSKSDCLPRVPFGEWKKFLFAGVDPSFELEELIGDMKRRLDWMPFDKALFQPHLSQDYLAKANWALYCENYLEGFHIPFVHPALAAVLDSKDYSTEIHRYSNLQIGVANNPADAFDMPKSAPDYGKNIAAYYYWFFPNMMFNFYPWGISVNVVVPLAVDRTRISYYTYVWDESKLGSGAGANTDKVEREDENIIELVQKGVTSRFYDRGRYSPSDEKGPHHFHRLLSEFLA